MIKEMKTVIVKVIRPNEGNWLTNGFVYVKEVSMPTDADESMWEEITNEEKEIREASIDEKEVIE